MSNIKKFSYSLMLASLIIIPMMYWLFGYENKISNNFKRYIVEPNYKINRYKQSDLIIDYDTYINLLRIDKNSVYISDHEYHVIIENKDIQITKELYDKYSKGTISYKKYVSKGIIIKD